MAFDNWANPEVITALCVGISSILGTIALIISKYRGKSLKEIIINFFANEDEDLKALKKQSKELVANVKKAKKSPNKT